MDAALVYGAVKTCGLGLNIYVHYGIFMGNLDEVTLRLVLRLAALPPLAPVMRWLGVDGLQQGIGEVALQRTKTVLAFCWWGGVWNLLIIPMPLADHSIGWWLVPELVGFYLTMRMLWEVLYGMELSILKRFHGLQAEDLRI